MGNEPERMELEKLMKLEPRKEFSALITDLSCLIEEGRKFAVRHVNMALTATYWLMGRRIVEYEQNGKERADYGEFLLKSISVKLSPYGRGFTERNLEQMRQFYLAYREIPHTLCAESFPGRYVQIYQILGNKFSLSWSHYRRLMRIEVFEERNFFESECNRGNWSVRQLDRQIQSQLYERVALSYKKEAVIAKANENPAILRPEDEIKDTYVLEFLGLKDEYSESDLENALIRHLENFLLELGMGFAFVARQKVFIVGGEHFRIDLLLFHRVLRCLILIELKITDFDPSYAGKMNFYINCAKNEATLPGENNPIGLILCSGKKKVHVEYALGGLSNKIFVSQYRLKLPKPEDLKREIERGQSLFLRNQPLT